jgi:hypothetical protein
MCFLWSTLFIGDQVTNAVFLGSPPPVGYGFSQFAIAGAYGTPIVSVLVGELIGRYANDYIMNVSIKRNNGVFEAESRLWACYIAIPLYICGFVTLGAAFQKHLSVGALIMGWGIAELAIMINTVAVYAYCNDAFPKHQVCTGKTFQDSYELSNKLRIEIYFCREKSVP